MISGIIFYPAFVSASTLMSLTPGIDTAVATKMVVSGGQKAGIAAAFGIGLGVVTQSALAGAGLVAIFTAMPFIFNAVKFAGAMYLLYLGFRALYDSVKKVTVIESGSAVDVRHAFIGGYLGDALNPKITLFIVTFYPQFIDNSHLASIFPYLVLGLTYGIIATIWYCIYAFIADKLVGRLGRHFGVIMTRVSGAVLIAMGIMSLVS